MPFVPYGKKNRKRRELLARSEADEVVIDWAVTGAQFAANRAPRHCLPICVLVERLLADALPALGFALRLGSLNVLPRDKGIDPISFDPRSSTGQVPSPGRLSADTPFHAWLEDSAGEVLDPSILLTLHADQYQVDPEDYVLGGLRRFEHSGLVFIYEEVHELELLGLRESEAHLARAIAFVRTGQPLDLGPNFLDVAWRTPPQS